MGITLSASCADRGSGRQIASAGAVIAGRPAASGAPQGVLLLKVDSRTGYVA